MTMGGASTESVAVVSTSYFKQLQHLLERLDLGAVERVVNALRDVRDRGGQVFLAGNGGSAATATHLANDFGKATKVGGTRPFRALCLSDNVSWFSALANDEGYERVFAGQLENLAQPGDLLLVISASGNSPNLVRAVELARRLDVTTVAMLGFDGGVLKGQVDEMLWLESEQGAYGLVESGHVVIGDILTTCLMNDKAAAGGE
jgi:D-sedoheptulose 7-phosphate isomerase